MSLKTIFILIAVIYFISPIDLLPDRFGWLARIDDFALILFLWWKYKKIMKTRTSTTHGVNDQRDKEKPEDKRNSSESRTDEANHQLNPFEVLGLTPPSEPAEIEAAYRRLMTQYHPDKVNHLGPELQKLAHEKTIQIQHAYHALRGE